MRKRMVASLPPEYDWIAFLDDDDVLLPRHLKALSIAAVEAEKTKLVDRWVQLATEPSNLRLAPDRT